MSAQLENAQILYALPEVHAVENPTEMVLLPVTEPAPRKKYTLGDQELLLASMRDLMQGHALELPAPKKRPDSALPKAQEIYTNFVLNPLPENEETIIMADLTKKVKQRNKSASGMVGYLVASGKLRPEHINPRDGSILTNRLLGDPYFDEHPEVIGMLGSYKLTEKSKVYTEAKRVFMENQRAEVQKTETNIQAVREALSIVVEENIAQTEQPAFTEQISVVIDKSPIHQKNLMKQTVARVAVAGTIFIGGVGLSHAEENNTQLPKQPTPIVADVSHFLGREVKEASQRVVPLSVDSSMHAALESSRGFYRKLFKTGKKGNM